MATQTKKTTAKPLAKATPKKAAVKAVSKKTAVKKTPAKPAVKKVPVKVKAVKPKAKAQKAVKAVKVTAPKTVAKKEAPKQIVLPPKVPKQPKVRSAEFYKKLSCALILVFVLELICMAVFFVEYRIIPREEMTISVQKNGVRRAENKNPEKIKRGEVRRSKQVTPQEAAAE